MSKEYRFSLDKTSKKHYCPNCTKKKFVRYVDAETRSYLPRQYGRCDSETNCSYHINPYTDGYARKIDEEHSVQSINDFKPRRKALRPRQQPAAPICFIPQKVLNKTLRSSRYEKNVFVQNLLHRVPFPIAKEDIERVVSQYYLGTVIQGYRAGAVTFPFIDIANNIRAIQVKQFDKKNHTAGTDLLHSIIRNYHLQSGAAQPDWLKAYCNNEKKVSCLFGEHLLNQHQLNPVALVEAPKTAVYGTLYLGFPNNPTNLLWLAVYNLSSLNFEKCKALKGRDVYLFPDLSKDGKAYDLWKSRAKEFNEQLPGTRFIVSDFFEKNAEEKMRHKGFDLADFLIELDWRKFRQDQTELPTLTREGSIFSESENSEKSAASKNNFILHDEASSKKNEEQGTEGEYLTVGTVFNFLKARHKSMPGNVQINVPDWQVTLRSTIT